MSRLRPRSFLPAYESSRQREPFDPDPISDLARLKPGYVVIGDSMAGRIDVRRLAQLSGRPVAPLLQAGSGSAYWYLALKNWVVASDIKPRAVFIFRDTNLTDVLFRLSPWTLDRVAREREDELNRVVATRAATPSHRLNSPSSGFIRGAAPDNGRSRRSCNGRHGF